MAKQNCAACEELRQSAPNVIVNGIDNTACTSLKNNTGLNPSSGHNDCTDLDNLNDCLVGNMAEEVDAYDVCDWRAFMKNFIPNVWTVFKGIICAICGIWTKIEDFLKRLAKIECIVNTLTKEQDFEVTEDYIRFANGVTKRTGTDTALPRLSGNAYAGYMTGSLQLPDGFTDNFPPESLSDHGVLLYEYRIKLSDFNLSKVFPGNLSPHIRATGVACHVFAFYSGDNPTKPYADGNSGYASYSVPSGYVYLQVRLGAYTYLPATGSLTLSGVLPVLMNPASFDCK